MNEMVVLIGYSIEPDSLGNQAKKEVRREIYCDQREISAKEFYAASTAGLRSAYKLIVHSSEYQGEDLAEYQGTVYQIYRTYRGRPEYTELYLSERVGTEGAAP